MKQIFMGQCNSAMCILLVDGSAVTVYEGEDIEKLKELPNSNSKHALQQAIGQLLTAVRVG